MRLWRTAVMMAAGLAMLAGCVAPEVPYDRETAGGIKRIGIITPHFPKKAAVVLASSVGKNLGLIGALVDVAMQSDREATLETVLRQKNFTASEILVQSITDGLRSRGYEVSMLPVHRAKADFLETYPTDASPTVDAYLDLVMTGYGFMAAGIQASAPYRPAVALRVRLVSAKTAAVLMQDKIIYDPIGTPNKAITIAPDPAYQFPNFDSLVGDPDTALRGLRVAIEQSALQVCLLMK